MYTRVAVVPLIILALVSTTAQSQFKSQGDIETRVANGVSDSPSASLLFGWFNPDSFHMRHTFSMSYSTFGGQGLSLGTYTNSMTYDFSQSFDARADVSMMYSPYNSFSPQGKGKNDLSSVFLSRAELNYRPWSNTLVQIQYRQIPFGTPYLSPFSSPWMGDDGF